VAASAVAEFAAPILESQPAEIIAEIKAVSLLKLEGEVGG
jgi:hypothetical protein